VVLLNVQEEKRNVAQHRIRNELLHEAVCARQDQLAAALGTKLTVPCPPHIVLRGGD
jgi:hypothetical protein